MSNWQARKPAWGLTEAEYHKALELSRDSNTPSDDSAAYWQLARMYRGQLFIRTEAERAFKLIRGVS